MPSHTLCALTRLSPCIAGVLIAGPDASTSAQYWTRQRTSLEHTFQARPALQTSCHLELNIRRLGTNPHHSLQVDTCGIRTHAGRPHRLSRPTPSPLGQSVFCKICKSAALQSRHSCDCQSLLLVTPSPHHLTLTPLMRTMCISRESNPGHIDGVYFTTRPLMPLENPWT